MHVGHTDTTRALCGIHLVAGDTAAIVYILSENRIARIGSHIVHIVAVHYHMVLVNNADSRINLIGEGVELNNIIHRTDVGGSTSDINTDDTAVERTVSHRHRVAFTRMEHCLSRGGDGVAVGERAVLKHTVGTVVAQLDQDIATVVGITTVIKVNPVEADAACLSHVHQHRLIGRHTLPRTAESHLTRCCGRLKCDEIGLRCTGDIGELGNAIRSSRQLNRQRAVDTATAQYIEAVLKCTEMRSGARAHCSLTAVGTVTGCEGGENRVVIRLVVTHPRLIVIQGDRIVHPGTDGMVTHGEHLVVVQMHPNAVATGQHARPVVVNRGLVIDTVPQSDSTQRINTVVLQPHHYRVCSNMARSSETGVYQRRHTAVGHQRQVFRGHEL